MKTVNHLGTDPIGKLVPRIAFPSMLAQFVSVLYSIVDRMYIGHIASVGDLALAGVGVCGPILTMIGAFSSLIGVGGAPLLGIRLGEKNEKEASRILANAFLMLVSLSLVLTAAALFLPLCTGWPRAADPFDAKLSCAGEVYNLFVVI